LHEVATRDWSGDLAGKSMTEIQRNAAAKLESTKCNGLGKEL
jgi:hypothetical protein